jgi:hypothetical protein
MIPPPPDQYSQSGGAVQVTLLNWLYKRDSKEERNRFVAASYQWHGVLYAQIFEYQYLNSLCL